MNTLTSINAPTVIRCALRGHQPFSGSYQVRLKDGVVERYNNLRFCRCRRRTWQAS